MKRNRGTISQQARPGLCLCFRSLAFSLGRGFVSRLAAKLLLLNSHLTFRGAASWLMKITRQHRVAGWHVSLLIIMSANYADLGPLTFRSGARDLRLLLVCLAAKLQKGKHIFRRLCLGFGF